MGRSLSHAVLIPTKGRPKALRKLFELCPVLNRSSTYVGIDHDSLDPQSCDPGYHEVFKTVANKVSKVAVFNRGGYTSVAREMLRRQATPMRYRRYVLVDDNCRFTPVALNRLLVAQERTGGVMGGAHPTARHFHAEKIRKGKVVQINDELLTIYPQVGMIFWCIPHALYAEYQYPNDCYFDDVHFILWCLSRGHTDFHCCLEAQFEKHLHEPGGTGDVATRIRKRGEGFIRLAQDYPQWMTTNILSTRVPYTKIIQAVKSGKKGFDQT